MWHSRRAIKEDEWELIPNLEAIIWEARIVWIGFDADPYRNPNVNRAQAELARVLTALGAIVLFFYLPHGPSGPDGLPGKMGIDDYIVANGPEAFSDLVYGILSQDQHMNLRQQ